MKIIITIIGFLIMSLSVGAQMPGMQMSGQNKKQSVYYTCPMHPEVKSNQPGKCPKCGMQLVKKQVKQSTPITNAKPKQTTISPVNNFPRDTKDRMSAPAQKQVVTYTCPMHPEIHAAKPGNCPKCGMKLIKEQPPKTGTPSPGHSGHEGMEMRDTSKMGGKTGMDMHEAHLEPIKTIANNTPPHTVRYDLYITDTMVRFGKKSKRAIAVNGQIPMPTLTFAEGDTAEIYVHNDLNEETSLHWHGLFLPNQYDGVPNLTQMPIRAHSTHLYRFPIRQHGTHWYHSHTKLQEQIGMYGAFIMNKRKEWDIPTIPIVISEWADMNPHEIERSLHNATDWFAIKKGSTQSYSEAIKGGHFKTKVTNEWKRMNAMDVSDVYYDKFLINGMNQNMQPQFKAGDKVRLRIANGGASDYFWLSFSGGKITVVASDGNDVVPVEVDRLIIAVSETYDVVVTIPGNKSYEFLVTPEDRTKSASLWLGSGEKVAAVKLPKLKYFAGMKMMNQMMDMNGNMLEMEGMVMRNQTMDMNTVMYPEITGSESDNESDQQMKMNDANSTMTNPIRSKATDSNMHMKEMTRMDREKEDAMKTMKMDDSSMDGMDMDNISTDIVTLNYGMLRAPGKTTLPPGPLKELKFDLTGNMNRYVWTLDNKTVSESDKILIKSGENVRVILFNNSMMRHPMHLHGHDFRVLNGQGDYAPLKNVLDMMPMERDTIEFAATESGDWFFHCHILYHMMSGMGRIFSYENSPTNPEIPNPKLAQRKLFADDRMPHFMATVGIQSNGSDGMAMLAQTRWKISTLWHLGYHDMHGYESETMVGRYLGRMQWWYPYIGFDYHYKKFNPDERNLFGSDERNLFGQVSNKEHRKTIAAGIAYTMPMLFIADGRIDGNGKFRFQLSRDDVPITKRLRFSMMVNTDKEYMAGFRYIITKYISASTHYDSDMGLGAGLTFTY